MIPFEVIAVSGPVRGSRAAAARAALREVLRRGARGRVLSLTAFFSAASPDGWRRARAEIEAAATGCFGVRTPPLTLVAQPPADRRTVAFEAAVLPPSAGSVRVTRRWEAAPAWTRLEAGGVRQVHAGAVRSAADEPDPEARAEEAFEAMDRVLTAEGLHFGHVVRQWNYLEDLLRIGSDATGARQAYQAFNDVRARSYSRSSFPFGYPASTGIGQGAGGVAIEFVALDAPADVRIEPLTNPEQVDAHRYSPRVLVGGAGAPSVALSPPKFERGKRIARDGVETVFLSGTAAVIGEASVAPGDVHAQTRTAILHLLALTGGRAPGYLRAYVKREGDVAAVRSVSAELLGAPPALCLLADVCRDELLVEIEGVLVAGGERAR